MDQTIAALVPDLIFATKIASTARSLGVQVANIRTLDQLTERLSSNHDALVLIDLEAADLDPIHAIELCKQSEHQPRTIAFGSHVRTDLLGAARRAGADEVLARSGFVGRLPSMLQSVSSGGAS
ncbi:MAG: response regulator [Planctomycetota bacterium]|nr:response regulator [Planctomycetota bacterium]MCZ6735942.1 response regulator [Planctomycetota bacterium]